MAWAARMRMSLFTASSNEFTSCPLSAAKLASASNAAISIFSSGIPNTSASGVFSYCPRTSFTSAISAARPAFVFANGAAINGIWSGLTLPSMIPCSIYTCAVLSRPGALTHERILAEASPFRAPTLFFSAGILAVSSSRAVASDSSVAILLSRSAMNSGPCFSIIAARFS